MWVECSKCGNRRHYERSIIGDATLRIAPCNECIRRAVDKALQKPQKSLANKVVKEAITYLKKIKENID